MKISILPVIFNNNLKQQKAVNAGYTNLIPLKADSVSFGAMKKQQFDGVDLAVVQRFHPKIEKFKSNEDFQNWAKIEIEKVLNQDFKGRHDETMQQRRNLLNEWVNYVLNENAAYNNAAALLILAAITKDLKHNNDKLPPVLNKGVLADCIDEIDKNIRADKAYKFNFNKMYETKLQASYLEDTKIEGINTGWILIPSKENDPENFKENVEKLKSLSHKSWCTKSFNAKPYLEQGDFHIYFEDGRPKIGIHFVDNKIKEIQGERNNGKIPFLYVDKVKKYIKKNDFDLTSTSSYEIKEAEKAKTRFNKAKKDLKKAIKNNDVKTILQYFRTDVEDDNKGFLTVSRYDQPSKNYSFSDLGIDENNLLKKIKRIDGYADFRSSDATNIGSVEFIGGSAEFKNSKITSLGNLECINGLAIFDNSEITSLGKLKKLGSDVSFHKSKIVDLGALKYIGGSATFLDSKITSLKNLEYIGQFANFMNSQVTDLGRLKYVGRNINIGRSKLTLEDFKDIECKGKITNTNPFDIEFS